MSAFGGEPDQLCSFRDFPGLTQTCLPEPRGVVEGTRCPLTRLHRSDILYGGRGRPRVGGPMQRRDFFKLLGGAAAGWPIAARAQQLRVPLIGLLYTGVPETSAAHIEAFRKGLSE